MFVDFWKISWYDVSSVINGRKAVLMKEKTSMCNRSVIVKLDDYTLNFVFSDRQHRAFLRTSFEHLHSNFEIHFIFSGGCRLVAEGMNRYVGANSVIIIPPKTPHYITDYSENIKKADFRVSAFSEDRHIDVPLPFLKDRITIAEGVVRSVAYAEDFFDAMSQSGKDGEIITRSALTLAYFSLIKELGLSDKDTTGTREAKSASFDYVIIEDCLMRNYMCGITLADVADKTGFTTTHIGRVIQKNYGMSYSELILLMRMTHAKKLIEEGYAVADIAKHVGYSSYNGFALAFKRYFKVSPEQMRKSIFKKK